LAIVGVKEENYALNGRQPARWIAGKICVCLGGKIISAERQDARLDVKAAALSMHA
jgi:hypothetical protein